MDQGLLASTAAHCAQKCAREGPDSAPLSPTPSHTVKTNPLISSGGSEAFCWGGRL